jgi:hypothetical protein
VEPGVNGWLCDHSDVGALALNLDEVASSPPEVLRAMGQAARNTASAHDRAEHLQRWTEIIRGAARGSLPDWAHERGATL